MPRDMPAQKQRIHQGQTDRYTFYPGNSTTLPTSHVRGTPHHNLLALFKRPSLPTSHHSVIHRNRPPASPKPHEGCADARAPIHTASPEPEPKGSFRNRGAEQCRSIWLVALTCKGWLSAWGSWDGLASLSDLLGRTDGLSRSSWSQSFAPGLPEELRVDVALAWGVQRESGENPA